MSHITDLEAKIEHHIDSYYDGLNKGEYELMCVHKKALIEVDVLLSKESEKDALLEAYNNAIVNDDDELCTKLKQILIAHHGVKW